MTYEQLEAFVAIVTYASISEAARHLYAAQSTLSMRVKQLEAELEVSLFVRGRGKRQVELSYHGKRFLPIAERWMALWKDAQAIKTLGNVQEITIVSVDVVSWFSLAPFFRECIQRFPHLRFTFKTQHSFEIQSLVEAREADIGFVLRRSNHPELKIIPVFEDSMMLVCKDNGTFRNGISCNELSTDQEAYLEWSPEWRHWHERHWGQSADYPIRLDVGSSLPFYLSVRGHWATAPQSSTEYLLALGDGLASYSLKEPPPPLTCYMVTNRRVPAGHRSAIELVTQELEHYIQGSDSLRPALA